MERLFSRVGIPPRVRDGSAQLLASSGLLVGAEMANRVTRIVTAVILARVFSIEEFGIAAAALTAHELTRMLIQNGLGTRIVAASDAEVHNVANTVHYLNWRLGIALFAIQAMVAWPDVDQFAQFLLLPEK